jgi:hypothetical protein
VRKFDEDAASLASQAAQFEATRNRFVAAYRALGIDPENASEGVAAARKNALEQRGDLEKLVGKLRLLQQTAGLAGVEADVRRLETDEEQLAGRAKDHADEESRLASWVSRVESLENEVARRQVDVVGAHLTRLEPATRGLYRRLSPHPIFGDITIKIDDETRELNVAAEAPPAICRPAGISVSPKAFFSDAQMNTLAITVFLAGALQQRWSSFDTIVIDDPVQQMDEMNVCAFLDLIRGLSRARQFIVLTCSRDFYYLAIEKLGCLNSVSPGSFLAYRLGGVAPAKLEICRDAP